MSDSEDTAEFEAFVTNYEVETSITKEAQEPEQVAEEVETEEAEVETEEAEVETEKTDKRKPSERIRELVKRGHEKDRTINNLVTRLENIESFGCLPVLYVPHT